MTIRPATERDALAIGRVQVETWRSAYRSIVPAAVLDGLSAQELGDGWRPVLANPGGARFVVVAAGEGDEPVGFAAGGPERSGDPAYRGELYAIYVLPAHQRQGLGLALVRSVAARLAGGGMPSMLLWVFEANAPARRFYERLGGAVVRNQSIEIGGVALAEVAYGWPRVDGLLDPPGGSAPSVR